MVDTINTFGFGQGIVSALLLIFKFGLTGAGFGLLLAGYVIPGKSRVEQAIIILAFSVLASTLGTLAVTLLLAAFNHYSPWLEWPLQGVFFAVGILVFRRSANKTVSAGSSMLAGLWSGIGVLFVLFSGIMMLSHRGEWIPGGWDPGIYLNQGVALARDGSHLHKSSTFINRMTENEQKLFRIDRDNRKQFLPGVIVDDKARALRFQFFHLTPAFVANLYRCGGLRAATRMNHFAAVMSCLELLCLLILVGSRSHAVLAVLILALQPVFVWHLQMPVSEMLQQFLIMGLMAAFSQRRQGWSFTVIAAFCLAAAVINRFSFLPFGCIFLACSAWFERMDRMPEDRCQDLLSHFYMIGVLVAAALYSWISSPVAVQGWGGVISGGLLGIAVVALAVIMAIDLLPLDSIFNKLRAVPAYVVMLAWFLWAPFFIFAPLCLYRMETTIDRWNLWELIFYTGVIWSATAWLGTMLMWLPGRSSKFLRIYVAFATVVASILILRKFIEPIYPWATRRYLPEVVPFIVIMASNVLAQLLAVANTWKTWARVLLLLVFVAGAGEILPRTRAAWRGTEFDGASSVLSEVARVIPADALVLTDHFLYATPLMFIYGKDVLVVSDLQGGDKDVTKRKFDKALAVLRALSANRSLYIFTITKAGLEYFPAKLPVADMVYDRSVTMRKMIHHRNRHPFEMEDVQQRFRVYKVRS